VRAHRLPLSVPPDEDVRVPIGPVERSIVAASHDCRATGEHRRVPVDAHDPLGRRDRHEHDRACLGEFPQPLTLGDDAAVRADAEECIGGQPVVCCLAPTDARLRLEVIERQDLVFHCSRSIGHGYPLPSM